MLETSANPFIIGGVTFPAGWVGETGGPKVQPQQGNHLFNDWPGSVYSYLQKNTSKISDQNKYQTNINNRIALIITRWQPVLQRARKGRDFYAFIRACPSGYKDKFGANLNNFLYTQYTNLIDYAQSRLNQRLTDQEAGEFANEVDMEFGNRLQTAAYNVLAGGCVDIDVLEDLYNNDTHVFNSNKQLLKDTIDAFGLLLNMPRDLLKAFHQVTVPVQPNEILALVGDNATEKIAYSDFLNREILSYGTLPEDTRNPSMRKVPNIPDEVIKYFKSDVKTRPKPLSRSTRFWGANQTNGSQILLIPTISGLYLLQGIDFETFEPKGFPFQDFTGKEECVEFTTSGQSSFTVAETSEEFSQSLDVAVKVSFSGFGAKASMSAAVSQTSHFKEDTTYLMGTSSLDKGEYQVPDWPSQKLEETATKVLKQGASAFRERYGTHCIVGYKKGGSLLIQGAFKVTDTSSSSSISAELKASWSGMAVSAEGTADFKSCLESHKGQVNIDFRTKWDGLSCSDYGPPMDFHNVRDYIVQFPSKCEGKKLCYIAVPYTNFKAYFDPFPIRTFSDPRLFDSSCRIMLMYNQYKLQSSEAKQYLIDLKLYDALMSLYDLFNKTSTEDILKDYVETEKKLVSLENSWTKALEDYAKTHMIDTSKNYRFVNKFWGDKLTQGWKNRNSLFGYSPDDGGDDTLWRFVSQEDGTYVIQNKYWGDKLQDKSGETITMYQGIDVRPDTLWCLETHPDGSFTIRNHLSGNALTQSFKDESVIKGYSGSDAGKDTWWNLQS